MSKKFSTLMFDYLRVHSLLKRVRTGTLAALELERRMVEIAEEMDSLFISQQSAVPEDIVALYKEEVEKLRKDSGRLAGIRHLVGFMDDNSSETLKIYQDSARHDFCIECGKIDVYGPTFESVIDEAIRKLRGK